MQKRFSVAADIGGTFTDIAVFSENALLATWKLPSTPDDYARAVVEGIDALDHRARIIIRRRRQFPGGEERVLAEHGDVGERAADIGRDAETLLHRAGLYG